MPRQPGQDAGEIAVAVEHWTYPGSTKKMRRPILMQMMGGKDLVSWARFFSTLHGRPDVIVIDGDGGADAAIEDLAGEKEGKPLRAEPGSGQSNADDGSLRVRMRGTAWTRRPNSRSERV